MNGSYGVPTAPPSVQLELYTFDDLLASGGEVAAWMQEARTRIMQPLEEHLQAAAPQAQRRRRTEWGEPGGVHLGLTLEDHRGRIEVRGADEAAWPKAVGFLSSGSLRSFAYELTVLDDRGLPGRDSAALRFDLNSNDPADVAPTVTAAVSRTLYSSLDDVQGAWVELLEDGAVRFHASTGYLTVGHPDADGQLRDAVQRASATRLRDCYWANVLSAQHIERLGGFDRLVRDAPCAVVKDLSRGRGERAYLQATQHLDDVPPAALARLREFLQPVLDETTERAFVPETAAADGRTLVVFKHESHEGGEPAGPTLVAHSGGDVEDLGWMTLSRAREFAAAHEYELAED